jgi:hypothetical protein
MALSDSSLNNLFGCTLETRSAYHVGTKSARAAPDKVLKARRHLHKYAPKGDDLEKAVSMVFN